MGYFQVRYDSRVVNYDHRGFIILATDGAKSCAQSLDNGSAIVKDDSRVVI